MNLFFAAAAALALLTTAVHLFAGGRDTARPLLAASDLDPVAKRTAYLAWHITSASLALLSGAFATAAVAPAAWELAAFGTVASVLYAIVSVAIAVSAGADVWRLPQWLAFALIAGIGAAGLAT